MTSAFYLPLGLDEGLETTVQRFGPAHDALELHLPVVEPDALARWIAVLRESREQNLARRPIAEIIAALDKVARRFLDPRDRARQEAIDSLSRTGRFGVPMLERALDDAFEPLVRGGIARWVASELGSSAVLDRPVPGPTGVRRRAHGPEWMLLILAGNVPAIPIWPILSALLLKAAVLAKTSAREPLLAPLFARTVAEVDEKLGACLAVVWWKGGSDDLDRTALSQAPAVLAFGGEDAMAGITRRTRPGSIVVLHGPKVSVAYVERRALTFAALGGLATRAAGDVALYDQRGCLSPHAIYVERRGEVPPAQFAAALSEALEVASREMPGGAAEPEEAASVQLYRAQARFEAGGIAAVSSLLAARSSGAASPVLESTATTGWTVVVEDRARFEPGPAHRTVRVHAVDGPEELGRILRPSLGAIEALGLEARGPERERLATYFADLGIPRVAPIGELQRPSPLGSHGGLRRLLPFVTWSTIEPARSVGAGPDATRSGRSRAPRKPRRSGRRRSRGSSR